MLCFAQNVVSSMARSSDSVPCGWCMDEFHDQCKVSIKNYDTIWYCKCEQCYKGDAAEVEDEVEDEATL